MDSTVITKTYSSSSNRNPGRDEGYLYKKSTYKSSYNENDYITRDRSPDKNIDQLDALLEDLKNERITTRKDTNQLTRDYSKFDVEKPQMKTTYKTEYVEKSYSENDNLTKNLDNLPAANYTTTKINYNDNSLYSPIKRSETSSVSHKTRDLFTNEYDAKTAAELENVTLTEKFLPPPGTKVTTTVRTYTYEVPASPAQHSVYNQLTESSFDTNVHLDKFSDASTMHSTGRLTAPRTVVYNAESYSTAERKKAPPSKIIQVNDRHETNTYNVNLLHNDTPNGNRPPNSTLGVHKIEDIERVERNDIDSKYNPNNAMGSPTPNQYKTNRYYLKETTNVVNKYHDVPPPNDRYINKPVPQNYQLNSVEERYPNEPNPPHVIYKYSSTHTSNIDERQKGITPPFPTTDDVYIPNANPPQRVDVLMESFGNGDSVDKSEIVTPQRKKEVETALALNEQPQNGPSVNRMGREVYYPPGQNLKIKHEEMHSGSAAGGRWAKQSGMYEYESGYKSKSKTKSGGAMVPVCLPLCCAMPCSIM